MLRPNEVMPHGTSFVYTGFERPFRSRRNSQRRRCRSITSTDDQLCGGTRSVQIDSYIAEHGGPDTVVFPDDADPQMPRPHVAMVQPQRLLFGQLERALSVFGECAEACHGA